MTRLAPLCPRCGSPDPRMHPRNGREVCHDLFHWRVRSSAIHVHDLPFPPEDRDEAVEHARKNIMFVKL